MNFSGIILGAAVFLSIGICHPAVIKMEYKWGKQCWWIWLVVGIACVAASLFVKNQILSTIIGGFAFSCLWGIHEMFLQEKRSPSILMDTASAVCVNSFTIALTLFRS